MTHRLNSIFDILKIFGDQIFDPMSLSFNLLWGSLGTDTLGPLGIALGGLGRQPENFYLQPSGVWNLFGTAKKVHTLLNRTRGDLSIAL